MPSSLQAVILYPDLAVPVRLNPTSKAMFGVVVVMVLYVCFGSVPCGGDTLAYTFVCCPDLFAYF